MSSERDKFDAGGRGGRGNAQCKNKNSQLLLACKASESVLAAATTREKVFPFNIAWIKAVGGTIYDFCFVD